MKDYKFILVDKREDAHVYRVRTHRAEVEIAIFKDGFIGITDLPQPSYDENMLDRFEADNRGMT